MPATLVERTATVGGYRTRLLEHEGDGPPILLLHGFADSADTWRPLMRTMERDGRRVVAADLPMFGKAERPAPIEILKTLDGFVEGVIDELGADGEVLIVGNSLGGLLSMRAASRPDLPVRGIAPIGPAGLGLQPWLGVVHRAGAALHTAARAPVPIGVLQRAAGELYRRLASSGAVDAGAVADFASHVGRGDPARLMLIARGLISELADPNVLRAEQITCPVVLIWGGKDKLCPASGAQIFVGAVPHTRLELLPARGHCVQIEDPHHVRKLVLDLDARSSGSGDVRPDRAA